MIIFTLDQINQETLSNLNIIRIVEVEDIHCKKQSVKFVTEGLYSSISIKSKT